MSAKQINIAVLVSGGGTNLQALIDAEKAGKLHSGRLALVLSNKPDAYALTRAANAGIPTAVVSKVQLGQDGMERREAILEAGRTRIRPILMTSVTTILGLIDMALSKNAGSAMMQPMAVVCIGGLIYATLMTLLVVPCIYDIFSKKPPRVLSDQELQLEGAE